MKTVKELEKEYCIDIQVCSKNRVGELCLLLQSLRTQSFTNFNVLILDDGSTTPNTSHDMFNKVIHRVKQEKHKLFMFRNDMSVGVCKARNRLIEESNKENTGANLFCRLDDDVICESDYLERLVRVIDMGYDMSSGITPPAANPEFLRRAEFVKPIINRLHFEQDGNVTVVGDDCGHSYYDDTVIPAHHLRSCFMYKKEVTDSGIRHELGLNWFREETFFSARAILNGFTMAVDTMAKVIHLITPSGGCRSVYPLANLDEENFQSWMKRKFEKHGDFLDEYEKKVLVKHKKIMENQQ